MNVYPKKMIDNLNLTKGLIFSQQVMIELTKNGFTREEAYKIVQKHARFSWSNNITLLKSLINDKNLTKKISIKKLNSIFDLSYHTKKIDYIFRRVF
jgi:adenylosuccinate lyase